MKSEIDMSVVNDDTLLRPAIISRIAFPDGSINERAIRKLMSDGKLESFMIGNKKYSNLRAVKNMVQKLKSAQVVA